MMRQKISNDQHGLVSILVSMTFITIIALVVTSFAFLVRREQRQSLDRQLSTQAFYAAESGVNDAIKKLETSTVTNDNCSMTASKLGTTTSLDPSSGVEYTCVLVKENPKSLEYSDIGVNSSTIVRVQADSTISSIRISWQAANGSKKFADANGKFFLPQASFNEDAANAENGNALGVHTGILRTMLIPANGTLTRDNLITKSKNYFLYPSTGSASDSTTYPYAGDQSDQGKFLDGKCNELRTPRYCSVTISGLGGLSSNIFYLRLRGIYQSPNVTVEAFSGSGTSTPLDLKNSQAIIDATGKANDVLRRIQVRVPLKNEYYYPEFALESGDDICKLLRVRTTEINEDCPYLSVSPH